MMYLARGNKYPVNANFGKVDLASVSQSGNSCMALGVIYRFNSDGRLGGSSGKSARQLGRKVALVLDTPRKLIRLEVPQGVWLTNFSIPGGY